MVVDARGSPHMNMRIAIVSIVVHQPHIDSGDEAIPGETLAICAMFGFTVASSLVKISGTLSEIQQFPALHIYRCHRLCPPWRCRMADAVSLSLSIKKWENVWSNGSASRASVVENDDDDYCRHST